MPLERPRQSASRHSPVVTNRPTTYRVRREPPLIQQPFHHPQACWSASAPFTHLIRGTQIPIAQAAIPTSPSRGFLPWRLAYAGPPVHAAPPSWGRHPQTFTEPDLRSLALLTHKRQSGAAEQPAVILSRFRPAVAGMYPFRLCLAWPQAQRASCCDARLTEFPGFPVARRQRTRSSHVGEPPYDARLRNIGSPRLLA
jgi:hypothetical protein